MDNYNIITLTDEYSEYEFYGVWSNHFKIGNLVFEAIEDPDDGYRSYLDSVVLCNEDTENMKNKFPRKPLGVVRVICSGDSNGTKNEIDIIDVKYNHKWLSVYTNHNCDYYPYFVFEYSPLDPEKMYDVDDKERSPEIINAERFI